MKHFSDKRLYWRSPEQFRDLTAADNGASKSNDRDYHGSGDNGVNRRSFLSLAGALLSLAGLSACRRPVEKIIPYVTQPEQITPGIPQFYATTMPFGRSAFGLIAESHEGRPTKLEGNPEHPGTLGVSSSFIQASMFDLYDPARSKKVHQSGSESDKDKFSAAWQGIYNEFTSNRGEGLAIVTSSYASPTLERMEKRFHETFPRADWIVYEPVSDENIFRGIEEATGRAYQPEHIYAKAKRILAIDSDFLQMETGAVTNTKGFAEKRNLATEQDEMSRLYVAESALSVTGAAADHRMRLRSSHVVPFAAALAVELRNLGLRIPGLANFDLGSAGAINSDWIKAVAKDLNDHRGESIVTAGRSLPVSVHALVFAINSALGNNGSTIVYRDITGGSLPDSTAFKNLAAKLDSGSIKTLVMADCNPVYDAPADLDFTSQLAKAERVIHFGYFKDESAEGADWHVPMMHFLESWGDAVSENGSLSVIQPLISPMFDGMSQTEFFTLLAEGSYRTGYDIVRETWNTIIRGDFESAWRKVLHDGILGGRSVAGIAPNVNGSRITRFLNDNPFTSTSESSSLEILFKASPTLYDGRYANNPWMLELPDPVTKMTWDNPLLLSPGTAENLSLTNGDIVTVSFGGNKLEMPVWTVPGYAENTVCALLGFGRTGLKQNAGYNTYKLRNSDSMHFGSGVTITKTGRNIELACVQDHDSLEGRALILEATLDEYRHDPGLEHFREHHPPQVSMWTEHKYDDGYQWGMAIDLNTCTGCNACVTACQSENNIPVVGRDEVINGREMHWLRIDRYFASSEENPDEPEVLFQPMMCQHCELAPCEQVCPVAATVHDKEGLNTMIYNRCIGTRYCSNNCPFKVRRFNFFNYTKDTPELNKMGNNPEVTVRSRGVMEKCTYCIQRLSRAKISAKLEERELKDGEVLTACQQSCPSNAIVFGNVNDPDSEVSRVKRRNREYTMLDGLNLKTRTSFLAKIRNRNPEIA